MKLADRIASIDAIQGRRFARLSGEALEIADAGILRHLSACDRHDVAPDPAAIREIIDDALNGRAIYAEIGQPLRRMRERQP